MSDTEEQFYTSPESMEPLLPTSREDELTALAGNILQEAGRLAGSVHSTLVLEKVTELVREMNSYYSNLIEGHKTLPRDIERALMSDYSSDVHVRNNQILSRVHIEVERAMTERIRREQGDVYSPDFICWLHGEFYRRLPESMQVSLTRQGRSYCIEPGKMRTFMVNVGRHTPPHFSALPLFLDRFQRFFGDDRMPVTRRLTAIAAAHHRLAWIHPFGDGNGRIVRLHSHALFAMHGIAGNGLWTLSRGLARNRERYFEFLQTADRPREDDRDGRGNLSDKGLAGFCRFFLGTVLDQVRFMGGLLALPGLRTRVEHYFQLETPHVPHYREEAMRVVRALVDEGEIPRGRVPEITGKGATVSAEIIKLCLREGWAESPSDKGVLRIAFPAKVLPSYFPQLFVDLPIEETHNV